MKNILFLIAAIAIVFVGCKKEEAGSEKWPSTPIPTDEIHYTSSDGEIIEPKHEDFGDGVTIVSNTYKNGKGIIKFNSPITRVPNSSFERCLNLTSIIIPDGVTEFGYMAFHNCRNLTSVTIPNSLSDLHYHVFNYCDNLEVFYGEHTSADNRCLIIDGILYAFAPAGLSEYIIPTGVTSIGQAVFYATNLKNITIPDGVTKISSMAFSYCDNLTSIDIPNSVTTIDGGFKYNSGLVTVTIGNGITTLKSPFLDCENLKAFYGGFASADNRCLILNDVLYSFAPAGLTEYAIPDNVATIEYAAFWYCDRLTTITIPGSVKSIKDSAFYGCRSLKNVYCQSTIPPTLADKVFQVYTDGENVTLESLQAIYVPRESVEAYKSSKSWSDYIDLIQGYDFE